MIDGRDWRWVHARVGKILVKKVASTGGAPRSIELAGAPKSVCQLLVFQVGPKMLSCEVDMEASLDEKGFNFMNHYSIL